MLTQGGPGTSTTVLVYYLYQQAFQFHHFGYGATLSMLLFAIVLVLTVAQWQMRKKWVFHEIVRASAAHARLRRSTGCCACCSFRSCSRPGGW